MTYYRSKTTKKIVTEKVINSLYDIYGRGAGNMVDEHILKELVEIVEDPSLDECLRHGNEGVAIVRFRELNPEISFEDAKKAIRDLKRELKIGFKPRRKQKSN